MLAVWSKNKKKMYTTVNPELYHMKMEFERVLIIWACLHDAQKLGICRLDV